MSHNCSKKSMQSECSLCERHHTCNCWASADTKFATSSELTQFGSLKVHARAPLIKAVIDDYKYVESKHIDDSFLYAYRHNFDLVACTIITGLEYMVYASRHHSQCKVVRIAQLPRRLMCFHCAALLRRSNNERWRWSHSLSLGSPSSGQWHFEGIVLYSW